MSRLPRLLVLVGVGFLVACGGDGDAASRSSPKKHVSFAVWYAPGAPDDSSALDALLTTGGEATVRHYETVDAWMAAEADVLVLRGTAETGMLAEDQFLASHDFEPLKRRRVLGIGHEAGSVFSALDLDISGKRCVTFEEPAPTLVLGEGPTLPEGRASTRLVAFKAAALRDGPDRWACEALYLPRLSPIAEPLARWRRDYAPLARQGNCIFCGIGADVRTWTTEFETVFREIALGLGHDPLEPFALSEWIVTQPGTYLFWLDPGQRATSDKAFYFRFREPVLFSASLEMERGGEVTMFFEPQATRRAMELVETEDGDRLQILMPVTKESVTANRSRYWVLRVTNFDHDTPAECTLHISHDPHAVLGFPGGLEVALRSPPRDEATVKKLIGFLGAEDEALALRAEAALLIVGEPAVPILEAAQKGADGDVWLRISEAIDQITEGR